MDDVAIEVKDLSKVFYPQLNSKRLKSLLGDKLRGTSKTAPGMKVLKKASFKVGKGEFLGIVGRNGSGKSTLLKILAGVYTATTGSVEVHGSLTPFIELGVGFNPELSGKDNVYLNGALLGFNRKEMNAMYDDIVEFAELEDFMDEKLRNYSSGMQVRLAFSIAIKADSDILLIDEVLAVGDANFQKKCFNIFSDLKKDGRTVVFVTHSMEQVTNFCDRAVVIEDGKITFDGSPQRAVKHYERLNNPVKKVKSPIKKKKEDDFSYRRGNNRATIDKLELDKKQYKVGDPAKFSVNYKAHEDGLKMFYGMSIYRKDRVQSVFALAGKVDATKKKIDFKLESLQLTPGEYYISIGLTDKEDAWGDPYDLIEKGFRFKVVPENAKAVYNLAPTHVKAEVTNEG